MSAHLRVDGPIIRDDQGQVFLVGVHYRGNSHGGMTNTWEFAPEDSLKIRSYGFNCIKFPIAWKFLESSAFEINNTYLAECAKAIKEFTSRGIYVIVLLETIENKEARGSLVDFIPMNKTNFMFADEFFTGAGPDSAREHLKFVLMALSNMFKDDSGIVGYVPLNSVHPDFENTRLSLQEINTDWWDIMDYLLAALRNNGDNHIFGAVGSPHEQDWSYMNRKLNDSNVFYEPHFYMGVSIDSGPILVDPLGLSIEWLRGQFGSSPGGVHIEEKIKQFYDVPWIIGEFGGWGVPQPRNFTDSQVLWEKNAVTIFEEQGNNMAGWFHFEYAHNSWNDYGLSEFLITVLQSSMVGHPIRFFDENM